MVTQQKPKKPKSTECSICKKNGKPIKRYDCKITHVDSARIQTWSVSKTVCLQIIEQLRKGFTVLKMLRQGSDRNTIYNIEGIK